MGMQAVELRDLTWINIVQPTQRDIQFLNMNFHFHPLDLDDCLSRNQRPKLDEYEDYIFTVMHFPYFDKTTRRLGALELDSFVGRNFLITVQDTMLKPVERILTACRESDAERDKYMGRGTYYLFYLIVDALVDYCYPILDKIITNINNIEQLIFQSRGRHTVREISIVRRNLINFLRVIRPQSIVIHQLENKEWDFLKGDLEVYWGDIADHTATIYGHLEDQREVLEGLSSMNETLTSYRTNDIMKVLTLFSVIMLPLSVISGIYGMNLEFLPLANTSYSFFVVIGLMLVIAGGMLGYFKYKDWL